MHRVLIANRSEIALRVIRTLQDLGMESVAVYSDTDRDAQFVEQADRAYALSGTRYADTYNNIEKVVAVALRSGADAVHPGYGFLSEVPEFAIAVRDAGLTWIGPSPEALRVLGDKIAARELAISLGVAPVDGLASVSGPDDVAAFVGRVGFPVVMKKSDGGGGRGIAVLESERDCEQFFAAHGHDLQGFFLERFVTTARHIETQCARDSHGAFAVISTRDCSVQRRHQKLIEEAPAPGLPTGVEETIAQWSQRLFDAVDYRGLGTCEFLVEPDGRVSFLEVNPRLQVEHTVTEEVTGTDLVALQFAIADGKEIGSLPPVTAHSFEFRITCEDPGDGMLPSEGAITRLRWPHGHGVRVEAGITEGDVVTADFDPMLAKVIVTAPTRPQAIARSIRALREMDIRGVATPVDLYVGLLRMEEFADHVPSTRWFEDEILTDLPGHGLEFPRRQSAHSVLPSVAEERAQFVVEVDGRRMELKVPRSILMPVRAERARGRGLQPLRAAHRDVRDARSGELVDPTGMVNSQIQAIVVRVCVELGQWVHRGDLLVVLESMKMESYVHAPYDGTVVEIAVENGQTVSAYQPLVRVVREED